MAEDLTNGEGSTHPRWATAVTLGQLGELVAEWLEGRITVPIYGDGPDPETTALIPVLAQLNRSGFVTDCSQPGEIDGAWAQRAAVSGYCEQDVAERVASISVRQDLVVVSHPAALDAPFELPITRTRSYTFTILCGGRAPSWGEEASWPWPDLHPELRAVLLSAWFVHACDPVWGRNDVLWPALTEAMSRSVEDVRGSLIDLDYIEAQEDAD